jgi:propanol-preferring alcohol dehydrogenase
MDLAHAAPILCAGVTVWRALKDSTAKAGDWVAVAGAGGGLGSLAVQYAKYLSMRVVAIDSQAKAKFCTDELEADAFVDYAASDFVQQIKKIADGVGVQATILCSNEPTSYLSATEYLRPTGGAMIVGLPPTGSHVPVDCRNAVLGMHTVRGCFVGTRSDVIDALDVVARGKVVPKVAVKPFSAIQETYDSMREGTLCGRVVVDREYLLIRTAALTGPVWE